MLQNHGSDPTSKPDLNKFRFADETMFTESDELGQTVVKCWKSLLIRKPAQKPQQQKSEEQKSLGPASA